MPMHRYAVVALAVVTVYYHLHLIFTGLIPNLVSRPVHLALALPWVFLLGRRAGLTTRLSGYLLCAFGVYACAYVALNRDALGDQYGYLEGGQQYLLAIGLVLVVLEMARRAIKLALPSVAALALAYGFLGQHLPGEFGHPGLPRAVYSAP